MKVWKISPVAVAIGHLRAVPEGVVELPPVVDGGDERHPLAVERVALERLEVEVIDHAGRVVGPVGGGIPGRLLRPRSAPACRAAPPCSRRHGSPGSGATSPPAPRRPARRSPSSPRARSIGLPAPAPPRRSAHPGPSRSGQQRAAPSRPASRRRASRAPAACAAARCSAADRGSNRRHMVRFLRLRRGSRKSLRPMRAIIHPGRPRFHRPPIGARAGRGGCSVDNPGRRHI